MTSQSVTAQAQATRERAVSWAPLAVILCGTFVYIIDFFVVNVALPSIQRGLAASPAAIEWVVAGYALTSASLLVTGGRLGDHYGRRKAFCAGIAAFTVTSALCAIAPDAGFLIAARLAQGVAAALMAPNVLSILGTTYTGPARVKAISAYGMVMGVAAAGGQLLGGVLISADVAGLGWRALFWLNVPVGIAAVVLAPRLVPESRAAAPGRLDLRGAAPAARNREISAHLERMERQLEQTQTAVSGLRALLSGPVPRAEIEFRTIPAVTALAVAQVVTADDLMSWGSGAFAELTEVLAATGLAPAGPFGALFPGEFFELERSEVTVFAPVDPAPADLPSAGAGPGRRGLAGLAPASRVRLTGIAGIEAAVARHDGPAEDVDRTYGALGTAVAERAIGVDGPIREYYPDGFDSDPYPMEICWPVFLTTRP
jgi:MFS family permease